MKTNFIYLILAILIAGCASNSKIKLNDLKQGEHVLFGKMSMDFNGKSAKEIRCEVYVNSEFRPTFQIPENGMVIFKTTDNLVNFIQISCFDKNNKLDSYWYNYSFSLPVLKTDPASTVMNYFGDISIKWNTQQKASLERAVASTTENDMQTASRDNHRYNKGKFSVKVIDNFTATKAEFLEFYKDDAKGFAFSNKAMIKKAPVKKKRRRRSKRRRRRSKRRSK